MSEDILHFGAVKLRITGSGIFRMTIKSLDLAQLYLLSPLPMSSTPDREPITLCNMNTQRLFLRGETADINETFIVNRIIVYARAIYTAYAQHQ